MGKAIFAPHLNILFLIVCITRLKDWIRLLAEHKIFEEDQIT